eukprot:COSAG05_NODE_11301_length_520_cov_1.330166_2_plen_80_part_00
MNSLVAARVVSDFFCSVALVGQPAHDLLFDTYKDLEADKKNVPRELYSNLMLLHSYPPPSIHGFRPPRLFCSALLCRVE